jgi:predicted RNA-binding protein with PUA-like domain
VNVDVKAVRKIPLIPLEALRKHRALAQMVTLRSGNRLSITPVTAAEWKFILGRLL